ncbi:CgeB family protein [Pseudomonas atacamensis]|uniref:CgeB family protein n=1 Tax=Pseudomonas atacamensis TaxID=2565368 RepID=UPI003809F299
MTGYHEQAKAPASIVVFEASVISGDCAEALQTLGFSVMTLALNEDNVMGLMSARPDYVLTINFNQFISEVCELLKIPYLAWVIDTPCYPIYDKAINHSHSFTFIYDAAVARRLRQSGVRQVYHLPVAANLERIGQIDFHKQDSLADTDISFVANLTRTEYRTSILPHLSVQTREGCSRLIGSLDRPDGFLNLSAQLGGELISAIKQESGYLLAGDRYLSVAEKLAYLLGREHSWQERIDVVQRLEQRFRVAVYGNNEWQAQIGSYVGHANHFTEMPRIFQRSKINLNIIRSFVETGLPMRVFDVLSCGGFLVSNDKHDLHKLFNDGQDLVIYRDTQDLLDICAYYLEHDEERRDIAQQGRVTLAQNHTFMQRMTDMLSTVQSELRGEPGAFSRWYR